MSWNLGEPPPDGKYYLLLIDDLENNVRRPVTGTRIGHNWTFFNLEGRQNFPPFWKIRAWNLIPPLNF